MRKLVVPAALALLVGFAVVPAAAFGGPSTAATVAPATRFVYVANVGVRSNNISQYEISAVGQLTPLRPPTVPGGNGPLQMAASPDGKSLYVSNFFDHNVSQYDVGADGLLTPKSPATVPAGLFPRHVAVGPNGANVYVINWQGNSVSQYDVGEGGTLTPKSPPSVALPAGSLPRGLSVSIDGRSLYVSNFGNDNISQYDIGPDGALTPKDPPTAPAGDAPRGNAVSPDGQSVYVTNSASDSISQYDVDAAGALTPKTPSTVAAGDRPTSVAVSPDGASVYVTNQFSDDISQYDIGPGGTLTPKDPATVPAGDAPTLDAPTLVAITPDGRNVYVANELGDDVSQYRVGPGGLLEPLIPPTVAAGDAPVGLAVVARVKTQHFSFEFTDPAGVNPCAPSITGVTTVQGDGVSHLTDTGSTFQLSSNAEGLFTFEPDDPSQLGASGHFVVQHRENVNYGQLKDLRITDTTRAVAHVEDGTNVPIQITTTLLISADGTVEVKVDSVRCGGQIVQ